MKIESVGVDSVILYFGNEISEEVLNKVHSAYLKLQSLDHIVNLVPSYHSLLVEYDLSYYDDTTIKQRIITYLKQMSHTVTPSGSSKTIEVVVDYSKGLDLERVAAFHHMSTDEVVALHSQQLYRVYAIGFMVGFAYLGILDSRLEMPRLATPRAKVPKGSVAIAQRQTAIYPQESAGGWHIIGHTDFESFEQFDIGDYVRFVDARL